MATVYLAHDLRHDRQVAIKVLRPELAAVVGAERFLAEIKTTANLQHPHILPLHDSGVVNGTVFYVMPFVEGESLRDRLTREKQLPVADAVRIAVEVAGALDYAHRRQVIHRDIKPDNILLHDGRALVADFGIALAAATTGGSRMTETGMSLGTPTYMSPEQAMGERTLDARTDIYALGCVLYEMLAGEPPFTGPTAQAIVAKVMVDEVRPLHELRKSVPAHVEAAARQALQKLPADRFATAAEFAEALGNPAFAGVAAVRRGQGSSGAGRRAAGIAAAVALLAGGVALGWTLRPPASVTHPRVRVDFVPDSAIPATDRTCCSPAVAISPDGRWIAYTVRKAGVRNVVVRDRDGFQPRFLATDYAEHPFFSAASDAIGFAHVDLAADSPAPALMRVGLDGGPASSVLPVRSTETTGAAWLPDGTIIYGHVDSPGLFRLAPGASAPVPFTVPDTAAGEYRHVSPAYAPGADGILFTIWPKSENRAEARVGFVPVGGGPVRDLGRGIGPRYTSAGYLVIASADGVLTAQKVDLRSGRRTGEPIRIAEGVEVAGGWTAHFAVSNDGTLVYDQGHLEGAMLVVTPGKAAKILPIHPEGVSHWDDPRSSPDGKLIAAAGSMRGLHQLFLLDPAGGTVQRFTFEGQTEFVDWAPDGRSLIYVRSGTALAEQAVDRSGGEKVLWAGDGGILGRVSVQGRWIAFAHSSPAGRPSSRDILVMHRDSLTPHPYLATRFDEAAPIIAPDGRWIAYVSRESERAEVYIGAFPNAGGGRQVVSTQGGTEPVWSRDGRTLFFRAGNGELTARDVRAGASVSLGPVRSVLKDGYERSPDAANYDVLAGAGSFVMSTTQPVNSRIVWILNAVPDRR